MKSNIDNFLLIIGAMKCGTTSLYNYLSQHPEIASCHTKEINFFGDPNRFNRGFYFYQNLWDWDSQLHKYALEATPSYTRVTHPQGVNAAANIARTAEETGAKFKFIYVLRNPVDRIESHYTQGRKYNHQDTAGQIEEGFNDEIIDTSRYAMQINEYYQRFADEDILLLDFENLKRQPDSMLKKVCNFLDIDPDYQFQDAGKVHNSYSQKTTKIPLPGYSRIRKTNFVKDTVKFMPKNLRQKLTVIRNLLAREHKYEYVKLTPQKRAELFQELNPDLEDLRTSYGFDTSSWT